MCDICEYGATGKPIIDCKRYIKLQAENEKIRNQWHIDLNEKVALQAENKRLKDLLRQEVDVGRADVDDIGFDAWLEQALKGSGE